MNQSMFEREVPMNFVALKMLTGDRAKYLGLIFAIAFCTFLLENQTSIFAGILKRTGSQILDVTDADIWVMDAKTEYFEQTKALKDTDLARVRAVDSVEWAVKLFKGTPVARTRAGKFAACILLGLDDATLTGAPRKMLLGSWQRLREPDSIVVDNAGYILLFPDEPLQLERELEMNDHKARIVGISNASIRSFTRATVRRLISLGASARSFPTCWCDHSPASAQKRFVGESRHKPVCVREQRISSGGIAFATT
jgi:putative ABC transport system permease protein